MTEVWLGCGITRWDYRPSRPSRQAIASFADIFYNNCFKNGMLPIRLSEAEVEDLFRRVKETEGYSISIRQPFASTFLHAKESLEVRFNQLHDYFGND